MRPLRGEMRLDASRPHVPGGGNESGCAPGHVPGGGDATGCARGLRKRVGVSWLHVPDGGNAFECVPYVSNVLECVVESGHSGTLAPNMAANYLDVWNSAYIQRHC